MSPAKAAQQRVLAKRGSKIPRSKTPPQGLGLTIRRIIGLVTRPLGGDYFSEPTPLLLDVDFHETGEQEESAKEDEQTPIQTEEYIDDDAIVEIEAPETPDTSVMRLRRSLRVSKQTRAHLRAERLQNKKNRLEGGTVSPAVATPNSRRRTSKNSAQNRSASVIKRKFQTFEGTSTSKDPETPLRRAAGSNAVKIGSGIKLAAEEVVSLSSGEDIGASSPPRKPGSLKDVSRETSEKVIESPSTNSMPQDATLQSIARTLTPRRTLTSTPTKQSDTPENKDKKIVQKRRAYKKYLRTNKRLSINPSSPSDTEESEHERSLAGGSPKNKPQVAELLEDGSKIFESYNTKMMNELMGQQSFIENLEVIEEPSVSSESKITHLKYSVDVETDDHKPGILRSSLQNHENANIVENESQVAIKLSELSLDRQPPPNSAESNSNESVSPVLAETQFFSAQPATLLFVDSNEDGVNVVDDIEELQRSKDTSNSIEFNIRNINESQLSSEALPSKSDSFSISQPIDSLAESAPSASAKHINDRQRLSSDVISNFNGSSLQGPRNTKKHRHTNIDDPKRRCDEETRQAELIDKLLLAEEKNLAYRQELKLVKEKLQSMEERLSEAVLRVSKDLVAYGVDESDTAVQDDEYLREPSAKRSKLNKKRQKGSERKLNRQKGRDTARGASTDRQIADDHTTGETEEVRDQEQEMINAMEPLEDLDDISFYSAPQTPTGGLSQKPSASNSSRAERLRQRRKAKTEVAADGKASGSEYEPESKAEESETQQEREPIVQLKYIIPPACREMDQALHDAKPIHPLHQLPWNYVNRVFEPPLPALNQSSKDTATGSPVPSKRKKKNGTSKAKSSAKVTLQRAQQESAVIEAEREESSTIGSEPLTRAPEREQSSTTGSEPLRRASDIEQSAMNTKIVQNKQRSLDEFINRTNQTTQQPYELRHHGTSTDQVIAVSRPNELEPGVKVEPSQTSSRRGTRQVESDLHQTAPIVSLSCAPILNLVKPHLDPLMGSESDPESSEEEADLNSNKPASQYRLKQQEPQNIPSSSPSQYVFKREETTSPVCSQDSANSNVLTKEPLAGTSTFLETSTQLSSTNPATDLHENVTSTASSSRQNITSLSEWPSDNIQPNNSASEIVIPNSSQSSRHPQKSMIETGIQSQEINSSAEDPPPHDRNFRPPVQRKIKK